MWWIFVLLPLLALGQDEVHCSDGKSICPSETTCCELSSGGFGCCPIPDAVCCSDKLHCCPSGMVCDTKEAKCTFGVFQRSMLKKIPAKLRDSGCDDPSFSCPDGTTCCSTESTLPGCCPMPNAVCCSDGTHCCPHKTTCDIEERKCLTAFDELPWFKGFRALKNFKRSKSSTSLHGSKCQKNSKRCANSKSNEDFCCPLKNGVCCEGKNKCCPYGFECSTNSDDCIKEENGVLIIMKMSP